MSQQLTEHVIPGRGPINSRTAWRQASVIGDADDCLIVLDAELYMHRVGAPAIIEQLQREGRIAPLDCVYISSVDAAARHADYTCNEAFTKFLTIDVRSWMEQFRSCRRATVCGLSLSGLEAAFAVFRFPQVFRGAICQSPSAWWQDEWLMEQVRHQADLFGRFWISVGKEELTAGVSHPPTGLYQGVNQRDSCRRLADALQDRVDAVRFSEYTGGHDPVCWAAELPDALIWTLRG